MAGLDNIGERNPCLKQRVTPGIFLKNEIDDDRLVRVPQIDPTVYNLKVNLRLGGANPPFFQRLITVYLKARKLQVIPQ